MRQRITLSISVSLLAAWGSLLFLGPTQRLHAQQPLRLQITRTFVAPRIPMQQTVYRLVPQLRTIADARTRATLLGLQPASLDRIQKVENEFKVSDGKWDYSLDSDRQIESLLDHEVMAGKKGRSPVIPDLDQCRDIALNFLGSKSLIAGTDAEELDYVSTNELLRSFVSVQDQGRPPGRPRVLMREVVFGKKIGGVPVVGPGSRVSVFVGDRGSVVGFMSNWMPAVATTQKISVSNADAAYNVLKDRLDVMNRRLPNPQLRARQITAEHSRYALSAFRNKQGELIVLPVYEFRGTLKDGLNRTLNFDHRVLAAADPAAVTRDLHIADLTPLKKPPLPGLRLKPPVKALPKQPGPTIRRPER